MAEEQYDDFIKRLQSSDEHQQPEMPAAAWEKMQAKLDDAFGKKKKRRRFFWLLLLAPLLLVGTWFSSMLGVKTGSEGKVPALQKEAQSPQTKKPNDSFITAEDSTSVTQRSTSDERLVTGEKSNAAPSDRSHSLNSFPVRESVEANTASQSKTSQSLIRNSREKHNQYKEPAASALNSLSKREVLPPSIEQPTPKIQADAQTGETAPFPQTVDATPHQFPADSFHLTSPFVLDRAALNFTSITKKQDTKPSTKSPLQFFAGASGMYTSSGVSLSRIGKGTSGYGVQLGLLWKRFSLSTGFNAGNVIYSVRGNEYKMGNSYPYGYTLQSVDAKCYVLDIPVMVNYIFPAKHRTSFFAGAGVASQLMKRENYDYTSVRNSMTWKGTWSYKNENKHFLSLLQIDAGINHRFSKTLFLQASPFFRTPLKGIGEGKVHLRTVGIQASLNVFPFSAKNN